LLRGPLSANTRLAIMAPISPISRKRSTPSHSDDDILDEPASKKVRLSPILPNTPPPEEPILVEKAGAPLFDDDPRRFLQRSLALALEHVGFDGASAEALESFTLDVEACQYYIFLPKAMF
jgi:transcription initiation factor TFIID subunit 8